MSKKIIFINKKTIKAVEEFINRKTRKSHPDGSFDKAKRWEPSDNEWCECCKSIRTPSRRFPFSLMTHCRSIGHIAALYEVDAGAVRKISNYLLKNPYPDGTFMKAIEAAEHVIRKTENYMPESDMHDYTNNPISPL